MKFSFDTIRLTETESTNTYAKALLKKGEPLMPYTLIYTEKQTAGRGRFDRNWYSTPGETLCMSLIVPFPFKPCVTLLSALGIHRALKCMGITDAKIKWPNDLVHENKKLCGILCESTQKAAVIGIGINLNNISFPADITHKATSLKALTGNSFDPYETAVKIAESIIEILEETKGELSAKTSDEYTNLCVNIGREISFKNKSGIAVGIAPDGSLIAHTEAGLEQITSGEVTVSGIY